MATTNPKLKWTPAQKREQMSKVKKRIEILDALEDDELQDVDSILLLIMGDMSRVAIESLRV